MDNWNLDSLFRNLDELDAFVNALRDKASNFESKYASNLEKIENCDDVLEEYEEVCEGIGRVMTYVTLLFSKDSNNGSLYAKYELISNDIESKIVFFELELANLDSNKLDNFTKNSKKYSYFLQKLQECKKYKLSHAEEKLLIKLSSISTNSFVRYFDEYISNMEFKLEDKKISEEEVLSKLHDSNRDIRKAAQKELTKRLKKSSPTLRYIINIIRKDLKIFKELRGYESVESFRHLSNQISKKSVDSMIDTVSNNFDLVSQYYKIKAELLGIEKLKDYDRYAPLNLNSHTTQYTYDESKKMVLDSFMDFSEVFGEITKRAFTQSWIDSHPKIGKRNGAFSHGATPHAHPYVLLNYTDGRRDLFTLAHELGHTIHQELSKSVGYLNMDTPLTTAETASVFGEMLLFDRMKSNLCRSDLISLYAGKLEDIFATLFRQTVMTNFERGIHSKDGELSVEELNNIWFNENARMFGDSIKLTKNYSLWWSYIPHFIHSPFYCYAYSYGQLLSLTLFGLYKNNYSNFKEKYIEFLSLGGSKSPKDLVGIFGFDIDDSSFWQYGINEVRKIFDEFKAIIKG